MIEKFDTHNKAEWRDAISQTFGEHPPKSASWVDPQGMIHVLNAFMGENLNHTMLPSGGGLDMGTVALAKEDGCLELATNPRMVDIFKPIVLHFEYFSDSPWNSFFLLEADNLEASGVYEEPDRAYEEIVELANGEYVDFSCRDTCILGHDEVGDEIPLPDNYRSITRFLDPGKFLIVAKRSIWNRNSKTYDGRHNSMTASEIREQIEHALSS